MIKLRLPLRHVKEVQPFGANYVNFYQRLGMVGHNGVDFEAHDGFDCYASHDGKITWAGTDGDGGISVRILHETEHYETIYYHLADVSVSAGERVKAGDKVGHCDNTGVYTTGSHLHFGLKLKDAANFNTLNIDNGYRGAINPAPYFCYSYNGVAIGAKDYNKSNAYHRYYRGRPKGGLQNEIKVLGQLLKKGMRPSAERLNALVYGGWDLETVKNDAARDLWAYLKKSEYEAGQRPFQN